MLLNLLKYVAYPFTLWSDIAAFFIKLLAFIPPPMMVLLAMALLIFIVRLIPL